MRTHHRGRLWIHAGLATDRREADEWAAANGTWVPEEPLGRGVILGSVELIDCLEESWSPWAVDGYYYWLLGNPRVLQHPAPHTGQLGFAWRAPPRGKTTKPKRDRRSYQRGGPQDHSRGLEETPDPLRRMRLYG